MSDAPPPSPACDASSRLLGDRVRRLRQGKGWTLEQLATETEVSRSMLSQIERGQANPTLVVAGRIARGLGITLSELAEEPASGAVIDVIRGDDPTYLFRSDEQCSVRTLSPLNLEKAVEFYELRLPADGVLRSAPHYQGTREYLHLHHGQVAIVSGQDTCELHKGDTAHYRADVDHVIKNTGRGDVLAYMVVTYERA